MIESPKFENSVGPENLKPRIRLEFFRHDESEPESETVSDRERKLKPEARAHATEIGKTKNPNVNVAFAYGSPRVRAQETALRQLLSRTGEPFDELSMVELNDEVKRRLPPALQGKLRVAPELDFKDNHNQEFHELSNQHYVGNKDLVDFQFREGDALVDRLNDLEDSSYSRLAANVATLVKKYLSILPKWKEIIEKGDDKYEGVNELQRFFGTHATIVESFLLKVIEKTKGRSEAEKFLNEMPYKNGIPYSTGVSITIEDSGGSPSVSMKYNDEEFIFSEDVLDSILKDRDDLDQRIKARLSTK